jgi:type I restriction enzyme M protein
MKTPRLVVQWHKHQAEARRFDAAIEANLKELGYGGRVA